MYFEARLRDIEERLGAVLSELGLSPCLELSGQRYHLFFQRTDEGVVWRSTVSFIFEPPSRTGETEVSWGNVAFGYGQSKVVPVGTNGWVVYAGDYDHRGYEIERGNYIETWDRAFKMAATGLRRFPLLPESTGLPYILDDGELARAWIGLKKLCKRKGIDEVLFGRDEDEQEYFEFDYAGSSFQLVGVIGELELFRDGSLVHVMSKFQFDENDFKCMFETQLDLATRQNKW